MGFFSDEEKTFTNLTFNDLFPKDYAVNAAKQSIFFTMENMSDFNSKFWSFKKTYRPRIKDSWMIKRGFKPSTPIKVDKLQEDLLLAEIQNTYDPDVNKLITFRISNGWIRDQAEFWLEQNGYDWSSKRHELVISTTEDDGTVTEIKYTRIEVKYKGESDDPDVKDNIDIIEAKFTVVDDDTIPPYYIDIPNEFKMDTIYVEYYRNTNDSDPIEVREEFYHYIIPRQGYDRLFISKEIVVTPIVPLKEEGHFRICGSPSGKGTSKNIPNETPYEEAMRKINCRKGQPKLPFGGTLPTDLLGDDYLEAEAKRKDKCRSGEECGKTSVTEYLKKYGVDPLDIIESLEETDDDGEPIVDNAYIMTGLKLLDPYDIAAGTYDSSEVQNYPPKFLDKAESNSDGSKYTFSQELCDWWRRKNKRFRHSYARLLYKTINTYGSGHVTISLAGARMLYTIDVEEEIHDGVLPNAIIEEVQDDGSIERTVNVRHGLIYVDQEKKREAEADFYEKLDGADFFEFLYLISMVGVKYLKSIEMQVDEKHYKIMHIYELREEIFISGQWFMLFGNGAWTSNSDKDDENKGEGKKYPRLLVPNDLHNHVNFTEYVLMKEYGMHFMLYSEKTIVIKWWKKFIGLVIGLIICFISYGTACGFIQIIINWIIAYAVSYVLNLILAQIDSPILRAIIQIVVAVVGALYGVGFDISALTSEAFLNLASSISSIAFNTYQQVQAIEMKEQQELEMEREAGSNIEESVDEYNNLDILPPEAILATDKSVHYSFIQTHGPEALFAKQESLFNYDALYDVSGAIDLRVQVTSG